MGDMLNNTLDTILVRKKNGNLEPFDLEKIAEAAKKAFLNVGCTEEEAETEAWIVATDVERELIGRCVNELNREDIHDAVQIAMMSRNKQAAVAYITYRTNRRLNHGTLDTLISAVKNITVETTRDNANVGNSPAGRMAQIASEANKHYALNYVLPKDIAQAHIDGRIHIHDLDYYSICHNCLTFDIGKLLKGGFQMPYGYIREPKSISAATALTAIAMQCVQNNQFGGVAITDFDTAMKDYIKEDTTDREIYQAMEALIYNFNSMHSRAGNQTIFASLPLGVDTDERARRVTKAFLNAYKAGLGHGEACMWPNIMFKVKSGINKEPGTPNHDLLMLSLGVSSRRLNPTYINCDSTFNAPFGTDATYMGCRTRLLANRHGESVAANRGNIAFVTIDLPMLALEANGNAVHFQVLLDKTLRLCARQLLHRWDVLRRLKVKDVPFIFGDNSIYMNSENLRPDDEIEPALINGSLTIGFCGIAEMCKAIMGHHQGESKEAQEFGLQVVKHIRDYADECCEKFNLNFSVIGSPAETTAGRFAKLTRKRFGVVAGVTDKEYFTNSCHVPVDYDITVADKAAIEGPYHTYCNGGLIFYTEIDGIPADNVNGLYQALLEICSKDIGYFGFNFPLDFCRRCNYLGAIDNNTCPVCGGTDIRSMKRVTGYFAEVNRLSDGKRAEVNDRTAHFGHQVTFTETEVTEK